MTTTTTFDLIGEIAAKGWFLTLKDEGSRYGEDQRWEASAEDCDGRYIGVAGPTAERAIEKLHAAVFGGIA